jgi:hypothetical protein
LATLGNSLIDDLAIVHPVCHHRRNVSIDLIKEVCQFGDVTDIIGRPFHRDDFMEKPERSSPESPIISYKTMS